MNKQTIGGLVALLAAMVACQPEKHNIPNRNAGSGGAAGDDSGGGAAGFASGSGGSGGSASGGARAGSGGFAGVGVGGAAGLATGGAAGGSVGGSGGSVGGASGSAAGAGGTDVGGAAGGSTSGADAGTVTGDAVCGIDHEGGAVRLTCPAGEVIKGFAFASFGNPTGTCPNLVMGTCSASNTATIVGTKCLGMGDCTVFVANDVFTPDPCPGTGKTLGVIATCAP